MILFPKTRTKHIQKYFQLSLFQPECQFKKSMFKEYTFQLAEKMLKGTIHTKKKNDQKIK